MSLQKGLIHIYTGDGKGKTTAGTGAAIRAAGAGLKVLIVRFLKNDKSSELKVIKNIDEIRIINTSEDYGFYFNMNEDEKKKTAEACAELLENAVNIVENEDYDMLILDEINVCVMLEIISDEILIEIMKNKPCKLEMILTGRGATEKMINNADYVSVINMIKHPFENGIKARIGIEE